MLTPAELHLVVTSSNDSLTFMALLICLSPGAGCSSGSSGCDQHDRTRSISVSGCDLLAPLSFEFCAGALCQKPSIGERLPRRLRAQEHLALVREDGSFRILRASSDLLEVE